MILKGAYASISAPGMLSGRQLETGVIALAAFFRNNSAASVRMGASAGVKSARIFQKYLLKVRGSSPGTTKEKFSPSKLSLGGISSVCQTPERSGLPSEERGAGAVRLGLPSRMRGVPGVGKFNHCACAQVERNANTTNSR